MRLRLVPSPSYTSQTPATRTIAAAIATAIALASAGCGVENPAFCDESSDCEAGLSCDLNTQTCGTKLSVDSTGWSLDEQGRWWTVERAPILRGTIDDPTFPTVQAYAAGLPLGPPAVVVDGAWEIAFPEGLLSTTDANPLEIRQILDEGSLSAAVTIISDPIAPTLSLMPPALYDERKDVVTFGPNGPVHERMGDRITPDATCPEVGLYAYLHGAQPPAFGSESEPNPVRFVPTIVGHPLSEPSVRWYLTPRGGSAVTGEITAERNAPFDVTSSAYADFAKGKVPLELTVVVRDWAGRQATASTCWTQVGVAAPLEISRTNLGELAGWSLLGNFPLSRLISPAGPDVAVFERTLRQHTDQPIEVRLGVRAGALSYTSRMKQLTLGSSSTPVDIRCDRCTGTSCEPPNPSPECRNYDLGPAEQVLPLQSGSANPGWGVSLVDEAGNSIPCSVGEQGSQECVIPARNPGEPARTFKAIASISSVPGLGRQDFTDVTLTRGVFTYYFTGVIQPSVARCHRKELVVTGPTTNRISTTYCRETRQYTSYTALDGATISISDTRQEPMWLTIGTRSAAAVPYATPPHHGFLDTRGMSWDGGDALLPGESPPPIDP